MKYLTSELWDKFRHLERTPVSFNGETFEALIRVLLNDRFPGVWKATPLTRDGGKDVVDRSIPGDVAWAECKMYRSPLSLQVVSNTLVMAVVESSVKRILFFSYSDMIVNAKRYLAKFALHADKAIQVFDGDLLETLILSSPRVMKTYFPTVVAPDVVEDGSRQPFIKAFFSSDVYTSHQQLTHIDGLERPRQHVIPIYTPCLYELIVNANHAVGKLSLTIDVDRIDFADFEILNLDQFQSMTNFTLESGQTLSLPIYLAPLVSGALVLPVLTISNGIRNLIQLPHVEVTVSAFERPILIGKRVHEFLLDFESTISSGNLNRVFVVRGGSGVGKSRFVDEGMTRLLKNGYDIHHFDGIYCIKRFKIRSSLAHDDEQTATFIRSLLCSFWRLPDPASFALGQEGTTPGENLPAAAFGEVTDIVYCWDAKRILEERGTIRATLLRGLCVHRGALVIDNVQAFPEQIIGVLIDLYENFVALPGQATMVLAFNEEDLIFNTAASGWLGNLRAASGSAAVTVLHLTDFTRPLAEEFVDNLFERDSDGKLFSELRPVLLNQILENIVPRPLDLWQFAKGLEDRSAIRAGKDVFTILNFEEFESALHVLNPDRESLLNWRMERLNSEPAAAIAVAAITYFGPLSRSEIFMLEIDDAVCQKLVQASILRENREHRLDFYHPSMTRHFIRDTKRGKILARTTKCTLYERAKLCDTRFTRLAEWFGLAYDVKGDLGSSLGITLSQFVGKDFSGYSPLHLAADRFINYVESCQTMGEWWPLLSGLTGAAHIASQGEVSVLRARTEHLSSFAARIAPNCPPDAETLTHWTHIIREMAGYMASAKGESAEADRLLTQALSSLAQPNQMATELPVRRAQAHLLNRRCVTLKNMGRRDEAILVAQASIELAQSSGMHDLVSLNLVDMGYVEYGLQSRNSALLKHWRGACKAFEDNHTAMGQDVENIAIVIALISGSVATISGEYDDALRTLDALLLDCRERYDRYYLLQAMVTKGTALIRQALTMPDKAEENCERVLTLGRTAEDLAGSMAQEKRYRSALYLQGKAYELLGNLDRARQCYEGATKVPVPKGMDYEGEVIRYDLIKLLGHPPSEAPFATTFSVNGVYLPLP